VATLQRLSVVSRVAELSSVGWLSGFRRLASRGLFGISVG